MALIRDKAGLPADIFTPDYDGGSIANIFPTAAAMLGAPFDGLPPMHDHLWRAFGDDVQHVVVMLIDAFGWNLVQRHQTRLAETLNRAHVVDKITSVFPSTTVNALSSLWTGTAPAHHGLMGLRIFLPELATIGQMIHLTPAYGMYPDSLVSGGLDAESFLERPGGATQLAKAGINTYALKHYTFVHSALSLMHSGGVADSLGVVNMADMAVELRRLMEAKADEKYFAIGYWHTVDTLSHRYGPQDETVAVDLAATIEQIRAATIEKLSPAARKGTVLILTGDHGQMACPRSESIYYRKHPELSDLLMMRPAGEPRLPYFFAKHGKVNAAADYMQERWSEQMVVMESDDALAAGLFGPAPHTTKARGRIGDLMGIMRHNYSFLTPDDEKRNFIGRHGSMSQDEMEIAWIGMRLDG